MSEFTTAPGKKTSEFYTMLIALVVSIGVMFGFIKPSMQEDLIQSLNAIIHSIFILIATISPAITYIISRTWLKAKTAKEIKND